MRRSSPPIRRMDWSIDTTGASHLHGGEKAMVAGMVERLAASASPRALRSPIAGGGAHAHRPL